jgi:hypothetical protein
MLIQKDYMKIWKFICAAITLVAFGSCFTNPFEKLNDLFNKAPDIGAVTRAIKVSMPLSYAANVAMDAANKRAFAGVSCSPGFGDTFPFSAIVTIPISKAHPLPVGKDTSGYMVALGLWSSRNYAVISVFFANKSIKDGTFTLANVAFVPVQRDSSGTTVVFASEDVNMDSTMIVTATLTDSIVNVKLQGIPTTLPTDSALAVNQKAWIVVVSPDGTRYSMYGASQYIGIDPSTTELIQAVMIGAVIKPSSCRLNPLEGYALIRDIRIKDTQTNSSVELGTTWLTFNNSCSGTATITVATGVYLARTGSTTALNLEK